MPFDLLPDELVLAIVIHIAHDPEVKLYPRLDSLQRICLVSRRFRRLTQPVLWENVRVEAGPALEAFMDHAQPTLASSTRRLYFEVKRRRTGRRYYAYNHLYRFKPEPFARLLRMLPNVEELEVLCLQPTNLSYKLLEAAPNLKKFKISFPKGMATAAPFLLPHLKHLELLGHWTLPEEALNNLTPACVPSLRVVMLASIRPLHTHRLHPTLLAQLELLQVNWQYARAFEEFGRRGSRVIVLATVALDQLLHEMERWSLPDVSCDQVRHLGLSDVNIGRIKDSVDIALSVLAQYSNLATLSIPRITATSAQRDEYQRLVQYAVEHDIKIIWNELAEEYDFDEAFYEYAKELRARGEV
ncbi:hypothetical protein JCM10449v2_000582 [Rhodotorula kratochvilovae]